MMETGIHFSEVGTSEVLLTQATRIMPVCLRMARNFVFGFKTRP
jgi:hypothetical protein